MSICEKGLEIKLKAEKITLEIKEDHALIKLSNAVCWESLSKIVLPDLKKTEKSCWYRGRKLKLRIHLGVYLLQKMFNFTDRQMEQCLKDNVAYRLFAGCSVVEKFHVPDHTKIEAFRSRLSEGTQQKLANEIAVLGVRANYCTPSVMDIDSTIQEANISYPNDTGLLVKLAGKVKSIYDTVSKVTPDLCKGMAIDMKLIKSQLRSIFFCAKSTSIEVKKQLQRKLWLEVTKASKQMIGICERSDELLSHVKLKWNIRKKIEQVGVYGRVCLQEAAYFFRHGQACATKSIYAFHAQAVGCFNKKKLDKRLQFGRAIQLGRLGGNFFIVKRCQTIREEDKQSVEPMLELHQSLFNENTLQSVALDKGYYKKKNEALIKVRGITSGLQKPRFKKKEPSLIDTELVSEELVCRRAGIEPLIGHVKHGGQLGKSRMKSDKTTESAAYGAVLGFNLRQFMRYQAGEIAMKVA